MFTKKSSLKESGVTYLVSQFKIQHTRRCQSRLSGKIFDKNHLMKIGLSNKELSCFGLPAHFQRQGEGGGAGERAGGLDMESCPQAQYESSHRRIFFKWLATTQTD